MSSGSTGTAGHRQPPSTPATILVIDDVAEIVEEMVEMLGLVDIVAAGVGTLRDAMAALEREAMIRIVICDLRLSRESGIDILARVKADPVLARRALRYVFVTGDPIQSEMLGAEFDGLVLSKPVQPRVLIDCLERMLTDEDGA